MSLQFHKTHRAWDTTQIAIESEPPGLGYNPNCDRNRAPRLANSPQSGARRPPGGRFEAFRVPGRKVGPRGLQKVVLTHSRPQPASGPRKPPEGGFGAFRAPGRKVGPRSFQEAVLEYFGSQAAKWAQEAPRRPFWSISGVSDLPGPGPRATFCILRGMRCGGIGESIFTQPRTSAPLPEIR